MLEAKIILEYGDAKTADTVASAVSPDNSNMPPGLHIETARKGRQVLTEIENDGKFATFIATIDDLLFCVSTAEKTLRAAKKAYFEQY